MECKILNAKYRIVATKIPRKTPGISIRYSRADVILINDDAAGLDRIDRVRRQLYKQQIS